MDLGESPECSANPLGGRLIGLDEHGHRAVPGQSGSTVVGPLDDMKRVRAVR